MAAESADPTQRRSLPIGWVLASLVLALGLPFLIFLSLTLSRQAAEDRERAGQQMLAVARVTAARLDDHVSDIQKILIVLSQVVGVDTNDIERNGALLQALQHRLPPQISNLHVWSADGRSVGSSNPSTQNLIPNVSDRRFFLDALASDRVVIEAPFASLFDGELIAIFALRIEREGRTLGVVSTSSRLRQLQSLVAPEGAVPAGSILSVTDEKGVILARSIDPDKWIGKSIAAAAGYARGRQRRDGVQDGPSADGIERIAGFASSVRAPWLVYVGLPVDVAIARSRERLKQSLGAGVGMLALGLMLSAWIARRISTPLRQLEAHANRIGAGALEHRMPPHGPAEIRSLGSSLNAMAAALEERTARAAASESALADLYANAPCGYYSLDASGRYTRVNETQLRWLGRARDEVLGKHVNDFQGEEGRAAFELSFPRLMEHGHVEDVEFELPSKTGEIRRIALSATAVVDQQGRFIETRTVTYDITELKEAEDARIRALSLKAENRQLVESNRVKSLFLMNMSHELRTPLNGILGYVQLLRGGAAPKDSAKFARFVSQIDVSGRKLLALIEGMLDFARSESDKFEFHPLEIDLRQWMERLLQIFEAEIDVKRLDVRTEIGAGPTTVFLDELRLTQVASAFISNAIKFSREGGQITLIARFEDGPGFCFEVIDAGIGIDDKDVALIFSPFRQLSEGVSKTYQGAGLGLALARRLVEAQGGSVGVSSRLGVGSVFTFRLPLQTR